MSQSEPSTRHDVRAPLRRAVTWRTVCRAGVGVPVTLLGLLWALQGADIVRIQPVLCATDCQPVTGGSPGWLILGLLTLLGGLAVLGVRPRRRRR